MPYPSPEGQSAPFDSFLQDTLSWSGSATVNNGAWRNYMELPGIALQPGGTLGLVQTPTEVRFPPSSKPSMVTFNVRITGLIGGPSGTPREWLTQIRRTDGRSIVSSSGDVKVTGVDVNNRDSTINSFTRDELDPFTVKGVQIGLSNISSQTITLTSVTIRVQRIINPQ